VTSSSHFARLAALAPWAALLALAAALCLQDIRSYDYWWHLRSGQLIFETGAVPLHDPFNYVVPGARWIDANWLYQLGTYALYSAGGHAAVVFAQLALVCALLAALAPIGRRTERSWLSVAALAWMLLVAANRFEPRPELVSFVLLACVLRALDRFERLGDRAVYAIVPLQLLWVNLHAFFSVGIVVCGLYLAGELMRPFGRAHEPVRWPRIRRLTAVIALSALVALANPNGVRGALLPLKLFQMVGAAGQHAGSTVVITELLPPLGTLGPLALGLFLGLAAFSLGALLLNWRRLRETDIVVWVAFFYLAMRANRNVALFAVIAAPLLVRNANEALDARDRSPRSAALAAALVTAFALFVAHDAARGRFHSRIGPFSTPGVGVIEGFSPIDAAEWIARNRPPQPLANTMGDGGYLIWRLWPEYRVMSDGRTLEAAPEVLYDDPAHFAALDARFRFGTALLPHRRMGLARLIAALHADPGWTLAHVDDVSVIFVRTAGDGARVPALDLAAPGLFPTLSGVGDIPARERFVARSRLLLLLGRPDLAVREWQPYLERFPDDPRGMEALARLRARAGGPAHAPRP
jgi:hypothetical protein